MVEGCLEDRLKAADPDAPRDRQCAAGAAEGPVAALEGELEFHGEVAVTATGGHPRTPSFAGGWRPARPGVLGPLELRGREVGLVLQSLGDEPGDVALERSAAACGQGFDFGEGFPGEPDTRRGDVGHCHNQNDIRVTSLWWQAPGERGPSPGERPDSDGPPSYSLPPRVGRGSRGRPSGGRTARRSQCRVTGPDWDGLTR